MKGIILKLGIIILRLIYMPLKLFKIQNKIVYISRQFNNPTMDFTLIKEAVEKIDSNTKNVILTKRLEKGLGNAIVYVLHIFKQMYHIATSKVVIVDTYCIAVSVLKHKKQTRIIQIWHAMGAIKKFGYQTIGKQSGADAKTAKIMCMHKNYDYVLCPSKITKDYYCEAFNIDENKILYMALPRVDYILQKRDTQKIYAEYPELREKKNVLYVPTFRKGKKIKLNKLVENFNTDKYNLIVKLHPLDRKAYTYKEKEGIIYDEKFTSYELLDIADMIISDYSSLAIETALLNKPLYFYNYDLEEYEESTGLNFKFNEEKIGKYMTTKAERLLELLEQDYDYSVLEDFRDRYVTVDINNCAGQLANFVMEIIKNDVNKEETKKEFKTDSKEKINI